MDDGALEALVAVLQADHTLYVCGRGLLGGKGECDWSLRDLLTSLGGEITWHLLLQMTKERRNDMDEINLI